jgi:hypothetical protein
MGMSRRMRCLATPHFFQIISYRTWFYILIDMIYKIYMIFLQSIFNLVNPVNPVVFSC